MIRSFAVLAVTILPPVIDRGLSATVNAADLTVKNVKLGEAVYGPPVAADQLQGAVVFVEHWGIHCGSCLGQIPHVAKLQDELGDFGLVIVAAHRQKATPDEIRATARTHGINYAVTTGSVSGSKAATIPHCFIFNADGKCVFDGHPGEAEKKLRAALGAALVAKADRSDFTKPVAAHVDALKDGKPPAGVLVKLLPLTQVKDADTAAQAKSLVDSLTWPASAALAAARSQKADDPLAAYDRAQRMATAFRNTPIGTDATKLLAELKSDKTVVAELRARPLIEKVRAVDQVLAKAMGDKEPTDTAFQKAAAPQLKQLQSAIGQLKRTYPDTRAAKDAVVLAEKYGLKVK